MSSIKRDALPESNVGKTRLQEPVEIERQERKKENKLLLQRPLKGLEQISNGNARIAKATKKCGVAPLW